MPFTVENNNHQDYLISFPDPTVVYFPMSGQTGSFSIPSGTFEGRPILNEAKRPAQTSSLSYVYDNTNNAISHSFGNINSNGWGSTFTGATWPKENIFAQFQEAPSGGTNAIDIDLRQPEVIFMTQSSNGAAPSHANEYRLNKYAPANGVYWDWHNLNNFGGFGGGTGLWINSSLPGFGVFDNNIFGFEIEFYEPIDVYEFSWEIVDQGISSHILDFPTTVEYSFNGTNFIDDLNPRMLKVGHAANASNTETGWRRKLQYSREEYDSGSLDFGVFGASPYHHYGLAQRGTGAKAGHRVLKGSNQNLVKKIRVSWLNNTGNIISPTNANNRFGNGGFDAIKDFRIKRVNYKKPDGIYLNQINTVTSFTDNQNPVPFKYAISYDAKNFEVVNNTVDVPYKERPDIRLSKFPVNSYRQKVQIVRLFEDNNGIEHNFNIHTVKVKGWDELNDLTFLDKDGFSFNDTLLDTKAWNSSRYDGKQLSAAKLNEFTAGDKSYGNSPLIEKYTRNIYIGNSIVSCDPDTLDDNTLLKIKDFSYLQSNYYITINDDGSITHNRLKQTKFNSSKERTNFYKSFLTDFPEGGSCRLILFDQKKKTNLKPTYPIYFNQGQLRHFIQFNQVIHPDDIPEPTEDGPNPASSLFFNPPYSNASTFSSADSASLAIELESQRHNIKYFPSDNILRFEAYQSSQILYGSGQDQAFTDTSSLAPGWNNTPTGLTYNWYHGFTEITNESILNQYYSANPRGYIIPDVAAYSSVPLENRKRQRVRGDRLAFFWEEVFRRKSSFSYQNDRRIFATFANKDIQPLRTIFTGNLAGASDPIRSNLLSELSTVEIKGFKEQLDLEPTVIGADSHIILNISPKTTLHDVYQTSEGSYYLGGGKPTSTNSKLIISQMDDASPSLLVNLNKQSEVPEGIGDKPFIIVPDNLHPYVLDNLTLFLSKAGINIADEATDSIEEIKKNKPRRPRLTPGVRKAIVRGRRRRLNIEEESNQDRRERERKNRRKKRKQNREERKENRQEKRQERRENRKERRENRQEKRQDRKENRRENRQDRREDRRENRQNRRENRRNRRRRR